MSDMSRRSLIKAVGGATLTLGLPLVGAPGQEHHPMKPGPGGQPTTYLFFHREEAVFIEAAVARLIPADD